ncbi:anthranilate phosphoribosyltransferase [Sutcliffiella rhizosphaerae]|uniref:Anthranilate phosphoribosyltransferase n=1 Tax=Sutcliffiella rhizosphaerae TaxID=2880967 RepID=A0ABM8YS08_9BACI|nr:anthranilate phosphoribosyltransferase [Sutcliffiella rhizosphaerae]CAG9622652.1 Anthranilate phosphoribosyltransferase [Sutcliffiella rhizosphaerae]
MFKKYLTKLIEGEQLTVQEAEEAMDLMMKGEVTSSQIASFISILRFRGETAQEMVGFTKAMRGHMKPLNYKHPHLIDTCGTGGDGASTFNISTAAAIVAASGGAKVAKHGNRAVSSSSGSADVLEQLHIPVQQSLDKAVKNLKEKGMSFLFAPLYHEAMQHAVVPRKEIGFRTIFNLLGPLANPVGCKKQVIGVYSVDYAYKMAEVLLKLGSEHVLIVSGQDGLDEITITGKTNVVEVRNGKITSYVIEPEDVGLSRGQMEEIQVANSRQSANLMMQIFQNNASKGAMNVVILNAGAALYVSGLAMSLSKGVNLAKRLLESGKAYELLKDLQNLGVNKYAN